MVQIKLNGHFIISPFIMEYHQMGVLKLKRRLYILWLNEYDADAPLFCDRLLLRCALLASIFLVEITCFLNSAMVLMGEPPDAADPSPTDPSNCEM